MTGLLFGKSILVTGGASGIGFATASLAAREGARVAVCDRDAANGNKAVEAISKLGGEAMFISMDVTDDAQVAAGVDACVRTFGRLDGAFNNAGIATEPSSPLVQNAADISESAWQLVLGVNLTGVWRCMRHQIGQMLRDGRGGSIVNNASIAGLVGLRGHAAYAASKHGVVGLTKSASADYARRGIRINAICPGFVATTMNQSIFDKAGPKAFEHVPLQRLGSTEEIAEAAVWLLSDRASFVTGVAMAVDGGYTAI